MRMMWLSLALREPTPLLTADAQGAKGMARFQPIRLWGFRTVAKPELGTKRLCASCGAKFYDLSKSPIHCPKCGTVFEVTAVTPRSRPDARAAAPREAPAAEAPEVQEAELVSLEEADAEAQGGGKKAPAAADAEASDDDVDETLGDDNDDDAFIPEEEEEDTDVTEIIGGDIEGDKDET
jgi:uncharacterized protein (TIGR02300 family)